MGAPCASVTVTNTLTRLTSTRSVVVGSDCRSGSAESKSAAPIGRNREKERAGQSRGASWRVFSSSNGIIPLRSSHACSPRSFADQLPWSESGSLDADLLKLDLLNAGSTELAPGSYRHAPLT